MYKQKCNSDECFNRIKYLIYLSFFEIHTLKLDKYIGMLPSQEAGVKQCDKFIKFKTAFNLIHP